MEDISDGLDYKRKVKVRKSSVKKRAFAKSRWDEVDELVKDGTF